MPQTNQHDPQVELVQTLLNQCGFPVTVDGDLGPQTRQALQTFQSENEDAEGNPLVADGTLGPLTLASLRALAASRGVPASPAPATTFFAGFDTGQFPGLPAMQTWKASSPYHFAGYYLKAPCHHSPSWMGNRTALAAMGWNLIVIYVGQQEAHICAACTLTRSQGTADGVDAAAKTLAEGFAAGSTIYLDVERVDAINQSWKDYIGAWVSQILQTAYLPGIYCHKMNAPDVQAAAKAAYPAGSTKPQPRFWIVGSGNPNFDIGSSSPLHVGIAFANLWQCPTSISRTFGSVTLNIDENIADRHDPSGLLLG